MSHSDITSNDSNNEHFQMVFEKGSNNNKRRNILRGFVDLSGAAALPVMSGCGLSSDDVVAEIPQVNPKTLSFTATGLSIAD